MSSDDSSKDEDDRINAMQAAILEDRLRAEKRLKEKYERNPKLDVKKGRCCWKFENEKGAKAVRVIDIILVPNLPRWIFAVWAKVDEDRWPIYGKVRVITFWVVWTAVFFGIMLSMILTQVEEDDANHGVYVNLMLVASLIVFGAIVDFHFTQVVLYHARIQAKRIRKEKKEKGKKNRAEGRFRRHSTLKL